MSEADNPSNWAFLEPLNSTRLTEPTSGNPPREDLLEGNPVTVDVSAVGMSTHSVDATGMITIVDTRTGTSPAEFAKMLTLTQDLRVANNQLLIRVQELTHALGECQKALQWHQVRSQASDSVIEQQHQELTVSTEKVKFLSQELELATQNASRQQILIETYQVQLDSSQERIAQLERECALIQTNYNEQSHQIQQSENNCRELRTRLVRQQRQTLQFKVALEKCLEARVPNADPTCDRVTDNEARQAKHTQPNDVFSPKVQPIPPWSADWKLADDLDEHDPASQIPPTTEEPVVTNEEIVDDWSDTWTQKAPVPESTEIHHPTTESIEEKLDHMLQMFSDSAADVASTTTELHTPPPEIEELQESLWESSTFHHEEPSPKLLSAGVPMEDEEPSSQTTDVAHSNWPSPLVYPERPLKKIKSLAAIDLPNFPQK